MVEWDWLCKSRCSVSECQSRSSGTRVLAALNDEVTLQYITALIYSALGRPQLRVVGGLKCPSSSAFSAPFWRYLVKLPILEGPASASLIRGALKALMPRPQKRQKYIERTRDPADEAPRRPCSAENAATLRTEGSTRSLRSSVTLTVGGSWLSLTD